MSIPAGHKFGPYEILGLIGTGGMGEVYRARDTRLDRLVAVKLVRRELVQLTGFRDRLQREARAISAVNHPNVCALYDIGEQGGFDYLVMEHVEGESLADLLKKGPLPTDHVLRYGAEIARGLSAAHARGIIHRDLKPGNIMITSTGAKVLDFGLARQFEPAVPSADAPTVIAEDQTSAGHVLGTVAYMSPEQAEGHPLDARTDIFALGIVLYEMVSGRRPFQGGSTLSTLASILREEPQAPRLLRPEIPSGLDRIVLRCLAKKPEERYGSASEVERELERLYPRTSARISAPKSLVAALAVLLVAVLVVAGVRWYRHLSGVRWAETVALPQAAQLVESWQPMAALKVLRQAEQYVSASPELIRLKEDLQIVPATIETEPAGAEIYAIDYDDRNTADFRLWEHLGTSPVTTDRLPRHGIYRIRAVKAEYESAEAVFPGERLRLELLTTGETPPGMVRIPARPAALLSFAYIRQPAARTTIGSFWMDRYEVTNRQFKEFVDAGGYQKREYWKHPFLRNGQELTWEEAMAGFRDATGRPGPSTWEAGTYPDGKDQFPVSGVSWYEAAAYAEFAGKSLPTVYHWYVASGIGLPWTQLTALSNFSGQGPAPAGSYQGLSLYGTYDMAGNVKEWTVNRAGENRYTLGGGWNEASYMFQQADARSPWDREATFGFRCVRYLSEIPADLNAENVIAPLKSRSQDEPADDRAFSLFKGLLSYDRTDLNPAPPVITDALHWRREYLSVQAAYGSERLPIYVYLPKSATPPYAAVFYFGGADVQQARTPEEIWNRLMEYILKSGRAVVLPAYAGTLERSRTPPIFLPAAVRDINIQRVKDIARTIDYIETRPDIDASRLAFYGLSLGTFPGTIALGVETRFKAAVLVSAGTIPPPLFPEVDTWNYAPRVKVPVLMINGKDDSLFNVESHQIPLFRALGTPEPDKRHSIYPGGHVDFLNRMEVIKEALGWLDRYMGPVRGARQ